MVFKILKEMHPEIIFNEGEEKIGYILEVDKDIWILIEFEVFEEDY